MLSDIAIEFYHLCEISLPREHVFNSALVEMESVCAKLKTVFFSQMSMNIIQKLIRCAAIPLAYRERGNQLCIRINRHEHPCIPHFFGVFGFHVLCFFGYESPNFIRLETLA